MLEEQVDHLRINKQVSIKAKMTGTRIIGYIHKNTMRKIVKLQLGMIWIWGKGRETEAKNSMEDIQRIGMYNTKAH